VRIISLTAVYGRPEVTKIWASGIRRLKNIITVVILSREDAQFHQNYEICKRTNLHTVEYPNNPLGEKLNQVITYILETFEFDYLMNIDSDDLIHPQLFTIYDGFIRHKNPFFGISKVYFVNLKTKETMISTENCWCAGRFLSQGLLKRMKGKPYFDDDNRGLDQRSAAKVESVTGITQTLVDTKDFPYVVDIKTIENLNDWNFIQSYAKPSDFGIIEKNYPKSITKLLC